MTAPAFGRASPPEAQARIGAVALELGVASTISHVSRNDALTRAAEEAARIAAGRLNEEVYAETSLFLHDDTSRFHLPSCVGLVCQRCGCSQYDPWDPGRVWHDPVTCTACA